MDEPKETKVESKTVNQQLEIEKETIRVTRIRPSQIVDYFFWVIVAVILLRFAFLLIGANKENAFVKLIYNFTQPMVGVFKGIVTDIQSGNFQIEISSLIALLVIWLLYQAVLRLFRLMGVK
jgi:uncharacterized protein YggT (Ycf19 family)